MKKSLFLILVIIFLGFGSLPATTQSYQFDVLDLTAHVPEDFGITIPDEALLLDRFVFENEIEVEDVEGFGTKHVYSLISSNEISLGELKENENSFSFRMLYYGNKERDYDIYLVMDIGNGLKMERNGMVFHIPVIVSLEPSEERPDDIICYSLGINEAYVHIPAVGPRRGIPVLDVELLWDGNADIAAGNYSAELKIELRMG